MNAGAVSPTDEGESPAITGFLHQPVMKEEVLVLFGLIEAPAPLVLDCTLGAGGHAEAILSRNASVRYVGIDADPEARERASARLAPFSERLEVLAGYFDDVLREYAEDTGRAKPDFILFDLGVSMHHYLDSGRGFSFANDEPLDMRFSPTAPESAYDLVNSRKEEELANLIFEFGEERYSRRIAKAICEARRRGAIRSSAVLADIVAGAVPAAYRHGRIHPATRTFQAIRIFVNDELDRERRALELAAELLAPSGIMVVISFHSLEDRIAKQLCREYGRNRGYQDIYKKPLEASGEERSANPASRSAKLRAIRAPLEAREPRPAGGRR